MSKILKDIKKNAEKKARIEATKAFNIVKKLSPVGNVSLWKTRYKPKGYVGGSFRRSWRIYKTSNGYVVANYMPYARRIDKGHSTQAKDGITKPLYKQLGIKK